MSLWLTVAIWIIYTLWSLIEIHGIYTLHTNRFSRYTDRGRVIAYLWVVFSVFWLCFQFIGS